MNCIQNYHVIYDKSSKVYNVPQKKNAWKIISAKLGIDIGEGQKQYNNIRTNFSKYTKRVQCTKSGSGHNNLPEIEDLEYLRWLALHIKHRQGAMNIKRKSKPVCSIIRYKPGFFR